MNHPIAQTVALTCYANAFLQGRMVPRFFPGHSTCTFCDSVKFFGVSRALWGATRKEEIASTPDAWFEYLKAAKTSAIHLSCAPRSHPKMSDRMSVGFVSGGGVWAMETVQHHGTRAIWLSRWEVWNQHAPERRIWRVSYYRGRSTRSSPTPAPDLEALAGRLRSALAEVHEFSARHRCDPFTARFSEAIETLDSGGTKRYGYHRDLAPDGCLPSRAVALLDACQSAWVFGGMGSWNDLGFPGEAKVEYDRTSERLFLILTEVVQAAANASCVVG
jgi:hypothetical protein